MYSLPTPMHHNIRDRVLQMWPDMFPGIDRVVMLFITGKDETGGGEMVLTGNQYRTKELLIEGLNDYLLKMTTEQVGYSWLHKDQLPFEHKSMEAGQLQLFSEQFHIVLMVRLKDHVHQSMDVYYIFFREDQSNFGVSRLQGVFDTTRKALVGSLAFRFANMMYQSFISWQQNFSEFTNVTRRLLSQKDSGLNQDRYCQWVNQWSKEFLSSFSLSQGIQLTLSEKAIKKLMDSGSYQAATEALQTAAKFALMLNNNQNGSIVIDENMILLDVTNSGNQQIIFPEGANLGNRLSKTILFLDKLEKAAQKLVEMGEDLTSSSVGKHMDRPITAPAITDALRKNMRRVILSLEKYPNRWPLIRHQFRPLTNILDKENQYRNIG